MDYTHRHMENLKLFFLAKNKRFIFQYLSRTNIYLLVAGGAFQILQNGVIKDTGRCCQVVDRMVAYQSKNRITAYPNVL